MPAENTLVQGDCIEWLNRQEEGFVDLVFADPPFNIGYKYDVYEDRKGYQEYYDWTHEWMAACERVLKPTGAFWVAIGAEYAAEVRMIGRQLGLTLRNWVMWHYTFGQNAKAKFARAHTHLFYFTKSPTDFTFNREAVAVLSDRQKEYNDKRAASLGRMPFDVWTEFPRVCGTFGERKGWHPCQMPEALLARIVRACSNRDELVLDPFAGSGTTLVVAKKLGRRYLGTELSEDYATNVRERLTETDAPDPDARWVSWHEQELSSLYLENSLDSRQYVQKPYLWSVFVEQFNHRVAAGGSDVVYPPEEVWGKLEELRTNAQLGRVRVHVPTDTAGEYPMPDLSAKGKWAGGSGKRKAKKRGRPSRKSAAEENLFSGSGE
jgi:site-specific DNA-methyltransferase (adenine-specific)